MTDYYESDGSVSTDGSPSLTLGPLSVMAKSKYNYSLVQYPADLNSDGAKGHSIIFQISNVKSVDIAKLSEEIVDTSTKAFESVSQKALGDIALETIKTGTEIYNQTKQAILEKGAVGVLQDVGNKAQSLLATQKIPQKTITLYMPDTMDFTQNAGYDTVSIADAADALPLGKIGKGVSAITSFIQKNDAARLAFSKVGYTFNPQAQVLFNGIDFRSYNLQFTFTPRSAREAQKVQEIIRSFRMYAAPTIMTAAGGFFFTPPSIFNLTFMSNGKENLNINRVTDSVLESVEVNYAPNGWSAHKDGAPVQTTMSLGFKEIILVDRTKILDGY